MTQVIALVALAIFSVGMVIIGLISAKKTSNMEGFLLGGRKIGPWMSAFAFGTSYFSAVIFVGYAGAHGWNIGLGSIWIGVGNALIGCLLAWTLMASRVRGMTHNLNARTMPELFEGRYDSKKMKIYSACVIFIFLLPYAASVYKGLGALFSAIFPSLDGLIPGVPASAICMFIVAALTAVYLVLGGYVAIALSDFIQGIIMLGGVILLVIGIMSNPNVGGFGNAVKNLKEINPQLTAPFGGVSAGFLTVNILLTSFGTFGLPQMVQKFYAIRDKSAIKRATIVSTFFALIIGCGAYLVGSMSRLMLSEVPAGGTDMIIPTILINTFSSDFAGSLLLAVILLLVLSASMSTLSSVVLTSSTAVTVDLLGVIKPKLGEKHKMALTRFACLVFVVLSFVFANFNFAIIVSIMSYSWGAVAGSFIGPFLWGLFSKKITRAGAWAGMAGGLLVMLVLTIVTTLTQPDFAVKGLYEAFKAASKSSPTFGVIAMGSSLVLTPVVSLFTKKLPAGVVEKAFAKGE